MVGYPAFGLGWPTAALSWPTACLPPTPSRPCIALHPVGVTHHPSPSDRPEDAAFFGRSRSRTMMGQNAEEYTPASVLAPRCSKRTRSPRSQPRSRSSRRCVVDRAVGWPSCGRLLVCVLLMPGRRCGWSAGACLFGRPLRPSRPVIYLLYTPPGHPHHPPTHSPPGEGNSS